MARRQQSPQQQQSPNIGQAIGDIALQQGIRSGIGSLMGSGSAAALADTGFTSSIPGVASGFLEMGAAPAIPGIGAGAAGAGAAAPSMLATAGPYAAVAIGAYLIGKKLGVFGHKSKTKGEEHLREALGQQGINIPNAGQKEWELNENFKRSRNEADLTGKDIIHGAQFYQKLGSAYAKATPEQQEAIANEALRLKGIREEHGQIDVNASPELMAFANNLFSQKQDSGRRKGSEPSRKKRKGSQMDEDFVLTPTPEPQVLPGPATVPASGFQPSAMSPQDYGNLIAQVYAQNSRQGNPITKMYSKY